MDLYHTTDADGVSMLSPDERSMRQLLATLDEPDAEQEGHPDVSLVHDPSGWTLTAYPSGIVTFENLDGEEDSPRFMAEVSRQACLTMWKELAAGKIERVAARPWLREEA
jgi:hypothetical protein